MKKALALALALSMLSSMAMAEQKTTEATAYGYGGELKVSVTTEDGKMVDIQLLESKETVPVMDRAFPVIRDRILEAQTPVVDSVTAATFSSYAVKAAVADAMKQQGTDFGSITFATSGPAVEKKDLEEAKTQLVIVGGGPAGLSAAIQAKESGLNDVILVEKLDILSGNGKFDMNFFDMVNTKAQRENGIHDTVEAFIEEKKAAGDSPERLQVWAEGESVLDDWLRGMGIELNYNYGLRNHMHEADDYAGDHIQKGLEARANALGVDIRTGTKGYDLIMEDGKAKGVKVETKAGNYDIYADAVVIATGGFCCNKELLAKYAPGYEVMETSNQMGATGDFVPVFEKYGFKLDQMGKMSVFSNILKSRRDLTGGTAGYLLVNQEGNRFIGEDTSGLTLGKAILAQTGSKAYYIFDMTNYNSFYRLRKHTALGYYQKGETLEELAAKLGMPEGALTATVEDYNKAVAGETEEKFRKAPFTRPFDAEGPYYGTAVEAANHMTKGGVVANEKAQILLEDGTPVENLFAAGEVTWQSGAYSSSVVFGRIAGEQAAKLING